MRKDYVYREREQNSQVPAKSCAKSNIKQLLDYLLSTMFRLLVSCTMLCLGASAYAPTVARRAPDTGEQFGLYAYGESVGGLSLFYADGKLYNLPADSMGPY